MKRLKIFYVMMVYIASVAPSLFAMEDIDLAMVNAIEQEKIWESIKSEMPQEQEEEAPREVSDEEAQMQRAIAESLRMLQEQPEPEEVSDDEARIQRAILESLQEQPQPEPEEVTLPDGITQAELDRQQELLAGFEKKEQPQEEVVLGSIPMDELSQQEELLQEFAKKKRIRQENDEKYGKDYVWPSLVDQFLSRYGVDIKEHLEVGDSYDLVKDPRFVMQMIDKNVMVLQVPVNPQRGAQCGLNAFENAKWLCALGDIDIALEFLNSPLLKQEVSEREGELRTFRGEDDKYIHVNQNDSMQRELGSYGRSGGDVQGDEMWKFNEGEFSTRVHGVYRTIMKARFSPADYFKQEKFVSVASGRFAKAQGKKYIPAPEVFVVNTGGHWVAIRIERMSNGMIGIVILDSIWRRATMNDFVVVDKIKAYKNWLKPLAKLFA